MDRKSLDNLLSRVGSLLAATGRQGVERRIPIALLEDIAVTTELAGRLAMPSRDAFRLARQLLGRGDPMPSGEPDQPDNDFIGSLALGPYIHIGVDLHALRVELKARLELAIETHVRPRRGRPRRARSARPTLPARDL